jgi:signal recognition particle subunit SRP54
MFDFLANKFSSVFSYVTGQKVLTEKNIDETFTKVHDTLLEADVPYHVVQKFINEVKAEVLGQKILKSVSAGEQFAKIMHEKLVAFLGGQSKSEFIFGKPALIMVLGLQGSGKTTTIAKLANYIKQSKAHGNRSILLASVDFYRFAAIDQLEVLARKVDVSFYRATSTDPIKAAHEITAYAKQQNFDTVFLDTAGRLHIDNKMLEELQQIDAHIQPTHKILVLDSMTGQESLQVAKTFDEAVGFEDALLTKIDSDTRAGAAFAFRFELKKPILFLGTGEKINELEPFRPERIAGRMLGMGDMQSLIEKANQKIKQSEQQAAQKTFESGHFTLDDFAKQMAMMNRLGSVSQLMKYIPGIQGQLSPEQAHHAEKEMLRFKTILSSMTPKERFNYKLLNGSRKARIAKGAGVAVSEVNNLLRRFEEMQQYAKLFKRMSKFPGLS